MYAHPVSGNIVGMIEVGEVSEHVGHAVFVCSRPAADWPRC
jgi:hypothetical protein